MRKRWLPPGRRPPSFGLVLSGLLAVAALAIVLAGRASTPPHAGGQPPTVGAGSTRACVTTGAKAQASARSAIVITASAQAPLTVTEQASGPRGIATVTRSVVVTSKVRVDQPIEVKQTVGSRRQACANAGSTTAARTVALRQAYQGALAAAHALAATDAEQALQTALHRQYPTVFADAQSKAAARAHQLALGEESTLAAQAQAEARRRAGD